MEEKYLRLKRVLAEFEITPDDFTPIGYQACTYIAQTFVPQLGFKFNFETCQNGDVWSHDLVKDFQDMLDMEETEEDKAKQLILPIKTKLKSFAAQTYSPREDCVANQSRAYWMGNLLRRIDSTMYYNIDTLNKYVAAEPREKMHRAVRDVRVIALFPNHPMLDDKDMYNILVTEEVNKYYEKKAKDTPLPLEISGERDEIIRSLLYLLNENAIPGTGFRLERVCLECGWHSTDLDATPEHKDGCMNAALEKICKTNLNLKL